MCIDAQALHCSREQVFVNCTWTNTYQYTVERKRWKHHVGNTLDFLCTLIGLALHASRSHVFAEAQRNLQDARHIPTLTTSDCGVQVNADRYSENIFLTNTQVVWRRSTTLRVNALQVIGRMSHGACMKVRLRDLIFNLSPVGYPAKGPGGEQVEKFYRHYEKTNYH